MKTNLATLDIGSNSFHLIVVSVTPSGNFRIIDRAREVVRLSEGLTNNTKLIQPKIINRAIEVISKFKIIAELHKATMRVVATSALRESQNKNEFIQTVLRHTGVEVEVINGVEEARLTYLGISKGVQKLNSKSLSVDIGGGSTEFIIGQRGKIEYAKSFKLGAVRLTQTFFPEFIITDKKIAEARKWVENFIAPIINLVKENEIKYFVGSSGTILNVGMMIQAMRGKENVILNNFEFTENELFNIENEILSRKSPDDRKLIPGLEEQRSDIIPGGIIIIATIFRMLGIKKMVISEYALREGVILDSLEKLVFIKT